MLCYFIYIIWVDVRKLGIVVFTLPEHLIHTPHAGLMEIILVLYKQVISLVNKCSNDCLRSDK